MIYSLKKYLNLAVMMLMIVLCFRNVEAVNIVDRCAGGYVCFHCSDGVASMFEPRIRNGIQAIFTVKCKNSRNLVVYDDRALLCFVPDISDELQIVRLLKVAFPVFGSCKNFLYRICYVFGQNIVFACDCECPC